MKTPAMPTDEGGWEKLASSLIKANLALAQMNYLDLERALASLGSTHGQKNISSKLKRGKFSAAFLLQCLVASGVESIELPRSAG